MTNFLSNRKSVREFKKKSVDLHQLEDLEKYLKDLEGEFDNNDFSFRLLENGERLYKALRGQGGYSGVMIESPHYISLELKNDKDTSKIYSGYYMEKIITNLNGLDLDTCWVSLAGVDQDRKEEIFGQGKGNIDYLLAFGYRKAKNPFAAEPFSYRIGVDELVYTSDLKPGVASEELEKRGLDDLFYYLRFAPSTLNSQQWRFVLDRDRVRLLLEYKKEDQAYLIDGGIMMYYFEALGESIGIKEKWLLNPEILNQGDKVYYFIGEIRL